jgi:hypothetical protein
MSRIYVIALFAILIAAALLAAGCTAAKAGGSANNSTVKGEGQIVDVGGSIPVQGEPSEKSGMTTSDSGDSIMLNDTAEKNDAPVSRGGSIGMGK